MNPQRDAIDDEGKNARSASHFTSDSDGRNQQQQQQQHFGGWPMYSDTARMDNGAFGASGGYYGMGMNGFGFMNSSSNNAFSGDDLHANSNLTYPNMMHPPSTRPQSSVPRGPPGLSYPPPGFINSNNYGPPPDLFDSYQVQSPSPYASSSFPFSGGHSLDASPSSGLMMDSTYPLIASPASPQRAPLYQRSPQRGAKSANIAAQFTTLRVSDLETPQLPPQSQPRPVTAPGSALKQISVQSLFASASKSDNSAPNQTSSLSAPRALPISHEQDATGTVFPSRALFPPAQPLEMPHPPTAFSVIRRPVSKPAQDHTPQDKGRALLSILKPRTPDVSSGLESASPEPLSLAALESEIVTAVAGEDKKPRSNKRSGPLRSTLNQPCELVLFKVTQSRVGRQEVVLHEDCSVVPEQVMTVLWRIPVNTLPTTSAPTTDPLTLLSSLDYAIGLFRYGSPENNKSVVSKSISQSTNKAVENDMFGKQVLVGKIQFRSPKTAGCFVYRLFDRTKPESAVETLGTSDRFFNDLHDADVTNMLIRSFEGFVPNKIVTDNFTSLLQLKCTVEGMRNPGRPVRNADPIVLLHKCTDILLSLLELSTTILDQAKVATKEASEVKEDEHFWEKATLAKKFHAEIHDILVSLRRSAVCWRVLEAGGGRQTAVEAALSRFSSITHRFYLSEVAKSVDLEEVLGFSLPPETMRLPPAHALPPLQTVNAAIAALIPTLLPPPTFLQQRANIAKRIESFILESGRFPRDASLKLFGSSRNGFGSETSDVDMCLLIPSEGNAVTAEEKREKIEALGEILQAAAGMEDVQVRSTSRIPIILFRDPESGLDCDISLHNALAISNTDLLLTYSCLDDRVRPLAYLIKRWAKLRQLNSPGDGTLSSYGFILCLLHFLQSLDIPIVPNLQILPPDWNGDVVLGKDAQQLYQYQLCVADNTPCNVYFLKPNEKQFMLLKSSAAMNKSSVAELLGQFFEYYALRFDYRHDVVSIKTRSRGSSQHPLRNNMKLVKAEEYCWQQHDRLSIEDPFECFYNVAHVIKAPQMQYIRKEFLRAHALFMRCMQPAGSTDSLPAVVDASAFLELLLEPAPTPAFSLEHRNGNQPATGAAVIE